MATVTITNTLAQPAYAGQCVLVTATSNNGFDQLANGQECELDANGNLGNIIELDTLNNQFKIQPQYPYSNLSAGSNPAVFGASQDVIVTVS